MHFCMAIALLVGAPALDAAAIAARVRAYVDAGLFSGVVLVSKGQKVVYENAFGLADRAFGVPNAPSTKFQILSVSKPITAAAILLLADRGLLSIEDPIGKYVPNFPNGDKITIEELLTHYSGLADAADLDEYDQWSRFPQTPQSMVDRLVKLPLASVPGTTYAYSASNYHLLALIIENTSKVPYGEFLTANIFKPLGMASTAHHGNAKAIVDRLAIGYLLKVPTGFELPDYLDWSSKTGNGSLYSTARDLLAFHEGLPKLLRPETLTAAYGFDRPGRDVGMFWYHDDFAGHRAVRASGSAPGYKSRLTCVLDDDVCVIALSNVHIESLGALTRDILSLAYSPGKPVPAPPAPAPRTAAELARIAGRYQFGHDFYTRDAVGTVSIDHGVTVLAYGHVVTTLVPLADGSYLDRRFWSFIRFTDDALVYRNGSSEFTAPRLL